MRDIEGLVTVYYRGSWRNCDKQKTSQTADDRHALMTKVLERSLEIGNESQVCLEFGVGRMNFYHWKCRHLGNVDAARR